MRVAVVDYGAGNIRSVLGALERLGAEGELTADPERIRSADRVIFPGQGEARTAMRNLTAAGLVPVLKSLTQPFLGICLGMQLLARHSEEGDTTCLGVFDLTVRRFPPTSGKVPLMGWLDQATTAPDCPLFRGLPEAFYAYFVHSYYVSLGPETAATATYGLPFSAALWRGNTYAVQYHPEKSAAAGQRLLDNFLKAPCV